MLVAIYLAALLVAIVNWPKWRRIVGVEIKSSRGRCSLVVAYWLLGATLACDLVASLVILTSAWPQARFAILLVLALGTLAQLPLFALVVTPILIRGNPRQYSFARAVMVIEVVTDFFVVVFCAELWS